MDEGRIEAAMQEDQETMAGILDTLRHGDQADLAKLAMTFEVERVDSVGHVTEVMDKLKEIGGPAPLIEAFVENAYAAGRLDALAKLFDQAAGTMTEGAAS